MGSLSPSKLSTSNFKHCELDLFVHGGLETQPSWSEQNWGFWVPPELEVPLWDAGIWELSHGLGTGKGHVSISASLLLHPEPVQAA